LLGFLTTVKSCCTPTSFAASQKINFLLWSRQSRKFKWLLAFDRFRYRAATCHLWVDDKCVIAQYVARL
jgi:hypothetical protein